MGFGNLRLRVLLRPRRRRGTDTGPLGAHVVRDLILALHQWLPAVRAPTEFRSLSHVRARAGRHRRGVTEHGIGTRAACHVSGNGSTGVHGLKRHGLAHGVVRIRQRRGVWDPVSHVRVAGVVVGHADGIAHGHGALLVGGAGEDGGTGCPVSLVLEAFPDDDRGSDDDGDEAYATDGDADDGARGHGGFAAAGVGLVLGDGG